MAVAEWVVAKVLAHAPDSAQAEWLEPCAGTGNFLRAMRDAGITRVQGFDLHPADPSIPKQDFLTFRTASVGLITVTNPPFGRNNALSVPFFNHAASMSDLIAFIVPQSWRKWSVQNRLNPQFQLVLDEDIAINYVNVQQEPITSASLLKTCLQIWEKSAQPRARIEIEDRHLIRRSNPEMADVALTIFGRGCGTVSTSFDRSRKITTQMYLKLLHPDALAALKAADLTKYFSRVAYTEALSIHEINAALNVVIFGSELRIARVPPKGLWGND